MKNPFEGDAEAIEKGRQLYGARCVFCHGGGGRGAKGPSLTTGRWKYGGRDEDVFRTISMGKAGTQMGAFGHTMDSDDIWKVIAYLREETRKRQAAGEIPK